MNTVDFEMRQQLHQRILDSTEDLDARIKACEDLDNLKGIADKPDPDVYSLMNYCSAFGKCWKCGKNESSLITTPTKQLHKQLQDLLSRYHSTGLTPAYRRCLAELIATTRQHCYISESNDNPEGVCSC